MIILKVENGESDVTIEGNFANVAAEICLGISAIAEAAKNKNPMLGEALRKTIVERITSGAILSKEDSK